jgi:hypothetical protein
MDNGLDSLPIGLGIDTLLRDVAYSNPLPDWFVAAHFDYPARTRAIQLKIKEYLAGTRPQKPFDISVPKKRGGEAKWLQPSVNDQMIIQTCVSSLAPQIDASIDWTGIYSYRYDSDPDSSLLTEDQCDAWEKFRDTSNQQAKSVTHVLHLDLEQSFASIDRDRFWAFLKRFSGSGIEIEILKAVLDGLAPSKTGVPMINNSLFFLGNAYFSLADDVIRKYTRNFQRFVDDYVVFGDSEGTLESQYTHIKQGMEGAGFHLNELKTNISGAGEYCSLLTKAQVTPGSQGDSDDESGPYGPVSAGVPNPKDLATSVADTIKQPQKYLNDGTGRSQLADLRRLRHSDSREEFAASLTERPALVRGGISLLKTYADNANEMWRSIWLLYLLKDVDSKKIQDERIRANLHDTLERIQGDKTTPEVVKLWAKSRTAPAPTSIFEQIADDDYEQAGRHYMGG